MSEEESTINSPEKNGYFSGLPGQVDSRELNIEDKPHRTPVFDAISLMDSLFDPDSGDLSEEANLDYLGGNAEGMVFKVKPPGSEQPLAVKFFVWASSDIEEKNLWLAAAENKPSGSTARLNHTYDVPNKEFATKIVMTSLLAQIKASRILPNNVSPDVAALSNNGHLVGYITPFEEGKDVFLADDENVIRPFFDKLKAIGVNMDAGEGASANAIKRPDGSVALIDLSLSTSGDNNQTELINNVTDQWYKKQL